MANEIMSVEGQLIGMPTAGPESFSQQQLDYLKRALGVDETVLYDKTDAQGATLSSPTITLSETYKNFSRLKVYWKTWNSLYSRVVSEFDLEMDNASFTCIGGFFSSSTIPSTFVINLTPNSAGTVLTFDKGKFAGLNTTSMSDATNSLVYKVVGINRISGGN